MAEKIRKAEITKISGEVEIKIFPGSPPFIEIVANGQKVVNLRVTTEFIDDDDPEDGKVRRAEEVFEKY
ncbi:MAG: hypothetical protein M1338_02150 [Patescibacteria group bacterium]|nr:hypothetical protein [Patescibacteria group bacterium]